MPPHISPNVSGPPLPVDALELAVVLALEVVLDALDDALLVDPLDDAELVALLVDPLDEDVVDMLVPLDVVPVDMLVPLDMVPEDMVPEDMVPEDMVPEDIVALDMLVPEVDANDPVVAPPAPVLPLDALVFDAPPPPEAVESCPVDAHAATRRLEKASKRRREGCMAAKLRFMAVSYHCNPSAGGAARACRECAAIRVARAARRPRSREHDVRRQVGDGLAIHHAALRRARRRAQLGRATGTIFTGPEGRSVIVGSGRIVCPGTRSTRARRRIVASPITASSIAKPCPMQMRGPAPKGK